MSLRISSLSKEYVRVKVSAKEDGSTVDPTALTVEMAFTSGEPVSGDWKTASWEDAGSAYYARCLVGPGGTVALADGAYAVWLRVTSVPEIPVRNVGRLVVT